MRFPKDAEWYMRIKLVRTMKKMTQEQLASELGTTRKQVYLWENGLSQPNDYTRKKLADWAQQPEEVLFKGLKR